MIFLTIQDRSFVRDRFTCCRCRSTLFFTRVSVISWGDWTVGFRQKDDDGRKNLPAERSDLQRTSPQDYGSKDESCTYKKQTCLTEKGMASRPSLTRVICCMVS